jgi:hypothetical protein
VYPENAMDNFSIYMFSDMIEQYTMNNGNRFDEWPNVFYYVMGDVTNTSAPGNVWLSADDWPVPYEEVSVFMTPSNGLTVNQPTFSDSFTYEYDPMDPVPTIGGQNLNIEKGPYDQRDVENRDDVIVFTTDVLTDSAWIAGPVKARLFVTSDCVDTDFTVKLTDVYPDGRSMLITDGIIRMRNRNGYDHWDFMNPGEVYEIEVDLWSTAYLFNEGHKIRVSVSSSNAPRFLPNPNTKDGWLKNESYNVAENTLFVGSEYPSQIVLPLVMLDYEKEVARSTLELKQLKQRFLQTHPLFRVVGKDMHSSLLNQN